MVSGLDALAVGGLGPDGKGVTDPRDARHAVGGLLAVQGPTALDIRTGVLVGPGSTALVGGTSDTGQMTYQINPHVLVGSRGVANGPYLGPTLDVPTKVNADPAPGSGSRIDVVWGRQRDGQSGIPSPDATTGPEYGVLAGASSTGTPVKPDLSTIVGATELATSQVSAGATSTNGAGVTIAQTARQTTTRGGQLLCWSRTERLALTAFPGLRALELDTGIAWRVDTASAWRQDGELVVASMGARPTASANLLGIRIRPADDPSRSYVCVTTGGVYYWIQDGIPPLGVNTPPPNSYWRRLEGTQVVTTAGGAFSFNLPSAFSAVPPIVSMVPGDSAGGVTQIQPVANNFTASLLYGAAFTANGSSVGNTTIRVNYVAHGYNT